MQERFMILASDTNIYRQRLTINKTEKNNRTIFQTMNYLYTAKAFIR